ncbi:MAG: excinuclease subunit [Actinomycetota bacterium]|nr:excinuclease subunit [Actinomycetota bacterium]
MSPVHRTLPGVADPVTYRPRTGEIPESPGVYRFRDEHGRVIYVGKAKNLRSRLTSYFADPASLHPRTRSMVTTAAGVEWTVVDTEVEALQLEYTWIKEFDPRFNIRYRDDKSYPYLAVTMSEEFPRVQVVRGARRRGNRYFGPYTHVWAIRETVDLLLRVFPVRTCSNSAFRRAERTGRPCLLGDIDKCSAPCVGRIDAAAHRARARDLCDFMAGRTRRFVRDREEEMHAAAAALDFERAARLRDDLTALRRVLEKSAVVLPDGTDADVFALAEDELQAAIQVFHVRDGRIKGQRGWVVEKVEEAGPAELVEHLLQQVYGDEAGGAVPREIFVPHEPPDLERMIRWLSDRRGSAVAVRVPQRGDKRALQQTVEKNAVQALTLHKSRRTGDLTARSQALRELQESLGLDRAPLRIECFDVSNLQGTHVVASMVVLEDGLPRPSEYRHFRVRGTEGVDDTASLYEVLTRRFRHHGPDALPDASPQASPDADGEPPGGASREPARRGRFAYPPDLLVVDGGRPQVDAAARALADLGIVDVFACGLAKRLEEVWLPGEDFPVVLPRGSDGLYLLQHARDESHRVAISYHRKRRGAALTAGELDGVPGLGPARRKALLKAFGSVRALRRADTDAIAQVPGIGPVLARTVVEHLAAREKRSAVDTSTGEIIDPDGA